MTSQVTGPIRADGRPWPSASAPQVCYLAFYELWRYETVQFLLVPLLVPSPLPPQFEYEIVLDGVAQRTPSVAHNDNGKFIIGWVDHAEQYRFA